MNENIKPRLLGGFGEITFGKQYKPGRRVYSSNDIAMAIMAQPIGQIGGYSYLYLIYEIDQSENDEIKKVGNVSGGITQSRTVYLDDGISPTLTAGMTHGNTIPYIVVECEDGNKM